MTELIVEWGMSREVRVELEGNFCKFSPKTGAQIDLYSQRRDKSYSHKSLYLYKHYCRAGISIPKRSEIII